MAKLTILKNPGDIALDAHGAIEAHAGTGKTYTIEKLVLRILEQRRKDRYIHIREVLLVTFTEKAAGELKSRIRAGIEGRIHRVSEEAALLDDSVLLAHHNALINHLSDCLNNLHEALIGTIHGVCLRLLQAWPFETGIPFGTELVDDKDGLESTLHVCIRTDWQNESTGILAALDWMCTQGITLGEADLKGIVSLAMRLLDEEHSVLDRRAIQGRRIPDVLRDIHRVEMRLEDHLEAEFRAWLLEYAAIAHELVSDLAYEEKKRDMALERIAQIRIMAETGVLRQEWLGKLEMIKGGSKFLKKGEEGIPYASELLGQLAQLREHEAYMLLGQKESLVEQFPGVLHCDVAEILRDRWLAHKERDGLLSFQDMLRLMEKAVHKTTFRDALRGRLQFGIIDEFQDTSVLQWNIFRMLFLEDAPAYGPRLYLVGDPKQSIYSFQGADVRTYMDARETLLACGGKLYGLVNNFRSTSALITGYNHILGSQEAGADWMAMDGVSYPSADEGGELASAPHRDTEPKSILQTPSGEPIAPVQVMLMSGSANERRRDMAQQVARVIHTLVGQTASIPKGPGYEEITLQYEHFAVVVEGHAAAEPFLDELHHQNIPAAKYKMEGVFQSPMAQDLIALLRAIVDPDADPSVRLAALLTRFYNLHPTSIVPEQELDQHSELSRHLRAWTALAEQRRYGVLFRTLSANTRIAERLAQLEDGERHLADLRQLTDYSIEQLVRGNLSVGQLVEHLQLLFDEDVKAGQDKNLHTLATDRSSVKVLTMHTSKGLEFPVVFVVTTGTDKSNPEAIWSWIDDERKQRVLAANKSSLADLFQKEMQGVSDAATWKLLSRTEAEKRAKAELTTPKVRRKKNDPVEDVNQEEQPVRLVLQNSLGVEDLSRLQRVQERRRLLYVALTRPQLLLIVPAQVDSYTCVGDDVDWDRCEPTKVPDQDLTPRLLALLKAGHLARFNSSDWLDLPSRSLAQNTAVLPVVSAQWTRAALAGDVVRQNISDLQLAERVVRQTSYSELSQKQTVHDRAIEPAEEEFHDSTASGDERAPSKLPGSAETGNALHLVIEECLGMNSLAWVESGQDTPAEIIASMQKELAKGGALRKLHTEEERDLAHQAAVQMVRGAFNDTLHLELLGVEKPVRLAELARSHRRAELEFQMRATAGWVHGFMDLVFRLPLEGPGHPWRYFVLDWKSNRLVDYSIARISESIVESHYDLQARLYCHALHMHLQNLLGAAYNAERNLGGAVYVYLRGYETQEHVDPWLYPCDPESDANYVRELLGSAFHSNVEEYSHD